MKNGFLRVAYATPDIKVADTGYNADKIIELINRASNDGVRVLTMPELCVTGYTCGDLFLQTTLLSSATEALERIMQATNGKEMIVSLGVPLVQGFKLYNCAAVLYNGEILGIVPKTFMANYGEFYEMRHFSVPQNTNGIIRLFGKEYPFGTKLLFQCSDMDELCIGAEICEDVWAPSPPSISHAMAGATLILNSSSSDETIGKDEYRRELIKSQSARLLCAYVYSNSGEGESTTDMVFGGQSIIAENGIVLKESKLFTNEYAYTEVDLQKLEGERRRMTTFTVQTNNEYQVICFHMTRSETQLSRSFDPRPFVPRADGEIQNRCEKIIAMQAMGLKKRIAHIGCKTVVLGISGGLDSCLALLVCIRAIDMLGRSRSDVVAITMPCFGTTDKTKTNAQMLCEELGVTFKEIPIFEAVELHFKDIGHDKSEMDHVYENAQARERTQVLMDVANAMDGIVIGTGDLSELALGWATYNGDHMAMYGVNASIPKTLVRYLVKHEADNSRTETLRDTLYKIINTPVSPELLPAKDGEISQKTEEIVGPYELHDFFIYYCLRYRFSPAKIYLLAQKAFEGEYDGATILHWLKSFYKRFFAHQFKRSCMPDGPKVGSVTLSPRGDLRMPSDASAAEWLKQLDEIG